MTTTAGSGSFWSGLGAGIGSLAIDYGASKLIDTNGPQTELMNPGTPGYGYAGTYGTTGGLAAPTSGISTTTIVVLAAVALVAFFVLRKAL